MTKAFGPPPLPLLFPIPPLSPSPFPFPISYHIPFPSSSPSPSPFPSPSSSPFSYPSPSPIPLASSSPSPSPSNSQPNWPSSRVWCRDPAHGVCACWQPAGCLGAGVIHARCANGSCEQWRLVRPSCLGECTALRMRIAHVGWACASPLNSCDPASCKLGNECSLTWSLAQATCLEHRRQTKVRASRRRPWRAARRRRQAHLFVFPIHCPHNPCCRQAALAGS